MIKSHWALEDWWKLTEVVSPNRQVQCWESVESMPETSGNNAVNRWQEESEWCWELVGMVPVIDGNWCLKEKTGAQLRTVGGEGNDWGTNYTIRNGPRKLKRFVQSYVPPSPTLLPLWNEALRWKLTRSRWACDFWLRWIHCAAVTGYLFANYGLKSENAEIAQHT